MRIQFRILIPLLLLFACEDAPDLTNAVLDSDIGSSTPLTTINDHAEIFNTNDQHSFVKLPDDHEWKIGDMICSGISHPCTAFDKWKFIPVVDDDYNVLDGILTYF